MWVRLYFPWIVNISVYCFVENIFRLLRGKNHEVVGEHAEMALVHLGHVRGNEQVRGHVRGGRELGPHNVLNLSHISD